MEDLAYRRLLDEYYLHERPLNDCSATVARQIGMIEHLQAVEYILTTFFEHIEGGFINRRSDQEIQRFHSKQEAASKAGKASAERRFNVGLTAVERPSTNHNHNHNHNHNQEPDLPSSTKKVVTPKKPTDVSEVVWISYLTLRKAKRAPVTELVILANRREAVKANMSLEEALTTCCELGWQAFNAGYWENRQATRPAYANPADVIHTTVPGKKERDPALVKIEQDRQNAAPPTAEVKAKMAELLGRMKS